MASNRLVCLRCTFLNCDATTLSTVEQDLDLEAAVLISKPKPLLSDAALQTARVPIALRELPGEPLMACGIHKGPMETLGLLIKALLYWVAANDYTAKAPLRELHFRDSDGALRQGQPRLSGNSAAG